MRPPAPAGKASRDSTVASNDPGLSRTSDGPATRTSSQGRRSRSPSATSKRSCRSVVPASTSTIPGRRTGPDTPRIRVREAEEVSSPATLAGPRWTGGASVPLSPRTPKAPADAMLLVADGLTTMNRKRFVEFAATHRIPAMYEWNFIVREGGLMSYGVSMEDGFRQGASPADLPAD